ncbi:serine/threonine-protein kinase 19 isoform X1 [Carex littledalei]|uniref:Serine/threonine-protein kinase 19 isoform X1 n=1 Tax=Carex littledalei TaxID=544730 RepID=A0A833R7C1_9POAL|nr:serine/threonine-protein kinase 19 isoform X1 [Carex littledalei]
MAESSHSGGKKRSRSESEEEPDVDATSIQSIRLENDLTFSDTSMALQMMRAQFPKLDKVVVQPFILRSQLYSSVKDRTQVDRDLESLKKEAVVRVFKLNTGTDDNAIMFMDDYLIQMDNAVKRLDVKDRELSEVFGWFKQYVIKSKTDVTISHPELCSLLSNGGDVTEKHVTLLINAGLLTRQLIDQNLYWFAIPNIGSILKGLSQGRKELISLINRTKYKEMVLANLEKKKLRLSPLDIRFHIRDLIGSGLLKTVQSPIGILIRLSRD